MKCVWLILCVLLPGALSAGIIDISVVATFQNALFGLELSPRCNASMALYFQNIMEGGDDHWALKMFDATSKIPVGILFSYNFAEIGDFSGCLAAESKDGLIKPKYCLGNINLDINISDIFISSDITRQANFRRAATRVAIDLQQNGNSNSIASPTWAICLPSACTDEDVLVILYELVKSKQAVCTTQEDVNKPLTKGAIATITILISFVVVMMASTAYDVYCRLHNIVPPSAVLIAFSVYSNGKKLFKTNKKSSELGCMNGIRVLSMVWVVVGHVLSTMTGIYPIFNFKDVIDWANSPISMVFVSGTLSVDSFFVVGGALLVYVFMKARHEGVKFNLFQFYLHRYLRLTPPLAAAVLVSATLLDYMGSGPNWRYTKMSFQDNCIDYWWSSLLYVQNYVNYNRMCFGQTWYLDMDMQLYILSPLILFPLLKYPKLGLSIVGACIIALIASPFYIAYDMELSGIMTSLAVKGSRDDYMNNYYLRTHTRVAPWFMGLLLGYILGKIKFREDKTAKPKINKALIILLWVICLAGVLACVFGGHGTLRGPEYNRLGNAFYIAFQRPAWALCIMWIIFACVMGYGGPINWLLSLPIYQVMNRFTYSLFILHVTILYMKGFALKRGVYFSIFDAAYSFWGIYMMTFALTLFWILAFESPVIVFERLIFQGSGKLANLTTETRVTKENGGTGAVP